MMTTRTYAIGDIHGRLDLLDKALARIRADRPRMARRIVCLGDYVDRGPDSFGVVERLIGAAEDGEAVCLCGNHEAMMLAALHAPASAAWSMWLSNGGKATLASYALAGGESHAVPDRHIAWLESLPTLFSEPGRVFVHAGLMPGVPLDLQADETRLWIRERFLAAPSSAFPIHVVHGHTPQWAGKRRIAVPELLVHRTNLDTGAYATGVLTVGVFEEGQGGPVEVWPVTI
jgi:serine/threonine protein phosphatase 1